MKLLTTIISGVLALGVFLTLNTKIGNIPPLGKFLSPQTGIWNNEKSEIDITDVSLPTKEEVTVHYDEHLIPHIFAQNNTDLYLAQGYITAKHRLWQMEFQTHAAAGRLSEIIGSDALNYDREQRRKGMVYGAEQSLKEVQKDKEIYSYLEAYTAGVNAYISSLDEKDYPVEYKLLDYAPEKWTPLKTNLLLMYMADMLAGHNNDLEKTNALRKLGKDHFDLLFPDFFDINDPVIPAERNWSDFKNVITHKAPDSSFPLDSISQTLHKPHPDNGSNNWAIGKEKSYSGNPILANDPHLGLNLPSIWFAIQLHSPDRNTMGVSLPGSLGIVIGYNKNVAWGVTNATRDVMDWYKIKFKTNNRDYYWHDNQWKKTTKRIEKIKQRGEKIALLDTIIYTHHGPVSYDHNYMGDSLKVGYAMQWMGHIGSNNLRTLVELNAAKNYEDYKNALTHYVAPAQNFVFASNSGDIALWVQGKFPNKWKGQGKYLMDGSNANHDWQGFIPQEHNAHVLNPNRGFVSSANQHPVDPSYPYYVFNDGYETYRNRVINDVLRSKDSMNIQDFIDLHNNNFNLNAKEVLPTLLASYDSIETSDTEDTILEELSNWDYQNTQEAVAPIYFKVWHDELFKLIWDELAVDNNAMIQPYIYQSNYMLKNHPNHIIMDRIETSEVETAVDLIQLSFATMVDEVNKWKKENDVVNWSNYKQTKVSHLLQGLPAFSRSNIPIGGGKSIVNATSSKHGPSWRMIVELTDTPIGIGIYPGGQSGNPGSKHYDDFINDWAAGKYLDLQFLQSKEETTNMISTIKIQPSL